ncbi:Carboxylesterase family protein [Taphrina deformans PYCC 5710]|uniref:Carboxylic ester hydrolase n=1 Tax=Taphrina deformans (strain PYCC 5710 / ATCC 11124 / CBS 356.35 / IMI 108563 / JCM 9778 / NBRC 8474) TaxID=1097556 RepID=R4XAT3_TAPDE|nr:Carboxylesterase family protein [Taphrina deformans PYCC 5710]|eukprot:CCG82969.1 Carboxylesterase family protein [Taphrina deformans PYCC 5710]
MVSLLLAFLSQFYAITAQSTSNDTNLLVSTNVGVFQGFQATSEVRAWLGVPFGAATNGSRRFRPPQKARALPTTQIFNATRFGLGCPQNKGATYQGSRLIGGLSSVGNFSEGDDCLNLNIWSPVSNGTSTTLAPVLIWIYGGSGQFGGSAVPYYNGQNFVEAQKDVIVVSLNYRTNIFGFPSGSLPVLPLAQSNLGLLDQRMAIEWVYNNIRAFGGDPERITLFGESAGAGAIGAYAYAYEFDPIVQGLIMESGSEEVFSSQGTLNITLAQTAWQTVANNSGCPLINGNQDAQFVCLQNAPFTTVQAAVSNTSLSGNFNAQVDNVTLYSEAEFTRRRSSGGFAKLPVLIGTNKDEGTIIPVPGVSADLVTLYGFACPAAVVAQSRANYSVPAYIYKYVGQYPNLNPYPALGVYHSSEIPMVFGTYNLSTVAPATAQQILTSSQIQGAWAAFARDPSHGLTNYGWQQYMTNGSSVNVLGSNSSSVATFLPASNYTSGCSFLFPQLV